MRHQVTNRISMFEPRGIAGFDEPRMQVRAPMFFVGIQREIAPPLVFGQSRLQRMRVILVEPGEAIDLADAGGDDSLPEVLPQLPAPPHHLALQPRLVQGEILRGENDELYEKIGGRIHRLRRLVSGPRGEILDVTAEPAPSTGPNQEDPLAQQKPQRQAPAIRKLLPDPGPRRIVCFGEYKQMLAPQLAHPERLRDAHRLPCHVQVYEAAAPQKFDAVSAAIFGNAGPSGRLQPLTHDVMMHLQLGPLLPAPPRIPHPGPRESGVVLPGERLFCLQVAGDPTAEESPEPPAAATREPVSHPALKTSIPERFLKPWEFQISREEALYDLSSASTFMGALGGTLWRLAHCVPFRREFHKWQVLLKGKNADEQLWSVRPPRGGLTHRFILAWAQNALQLAGYDPRNMLTEWHIFWRRKGV
jgi:hypothetical protein